MSSQESAVVKQWRQHLIHTQKILMLDGRTKEAKKRMAQRNLLISTASDEELEEMAKLEADFFSVPVDQALKDLRKVREDHRKTMKSWRRHLGKSKAFETRHNS